jgi:hypothetical protein
MILEGWLCPALFRYFEAAPKVLLWKPEALKSPIWGLVFDLAATSARDDCIERREIVTADRPWALREAHSIGLRNCPSRRWRYCEIWRHNNRPCRLSAKSIAYELFERLMARSTHRKSWMGIERYVAALIRSYQRSQIAQSFRTDLKSWESFPSTESDWCIRLQCR